MAIVSMQEQAANEGDGSTRTFSDSRNLFGGEHLVHDQAQQGGERDTRVDTEKINPAANPAFFGAVSTT